LGVDKEDYGRNLHAPEFYWERVRAFFPGLLVDDLQLHQAGIQARLMDHLDWIIEPDANEDRFINLIGIDSPGLTASLAIARDVVDELLTI
jgi:L-2-hydroxyglutarate oxidase LhgO